MRPATASNIRICFIAVCRDVKPCPHGLIISGVTNRLCLSAASPDAAPEREAALTLAVSIFLGEDGRKKSVPFVLTVIDPRDREAFLSSFRIDKASQQTVDTQALSVILKVSDPGVYWLKLYSRQRELHRVPLDVTFKAERRAKIARTPLHIKA